MKRNVIIIFLGFLFYFNPLTAVNKYIESNTVQDSLVILKDRIERERTKLMMVELERQKEIVDKHILINEHKKILLKYKVITYSACSFSILMIGLSFLLFLKNRNKKRILNKQ
jgi:hypothetical protein